MSKDGLSVKFNVKNIGDYKASVVAFVFLTFPDEVKNYPVRVFKGFEKKELNRVLKLKLLLFHMIYLIIVLKKMILLDQKKVVLKFMLVLMLKIIINWKGKLKLNIK